MMSRQQRIPSVLMPAAFANVGLEPNIRHGSTYLGVQKCPDSKRKEGQKDRSCGNRNVPDIDLQNARQCLVVIALQGNGGTKVPLPERPQTMLGLGKAEPIMHIKEAKENPT